LAPGSILRLTSLIVITGQRVRLGVAAPMTSSAKQSVGSKGAGLRRRYRSSQ
jgi:hypothetical protein